MVIMLAYLYFRLSLALPASLYLGAKIYSKCGSVKLI